MLDNSQIQFLDLSQPADKLNELIESAQARYLAFFRGQDEGVDAYFECVFGCLASCEEQGKRRASCARGQIRGSNGRLLSLYKAYPKERGVVSVAEDYHLAAIYLQGMICETNLVRESGVRFSSDLVYGRDEAFALLLSERVPEFLFVPEAVYAADQVFDEASDSTPQSRDLRWYTDGVKAFSDILLSEGRLSRAVQYGFLYLSAQRFKANQNAKVKGVFPSPGECDAYLAQVSSLLGMVDNEVLFEPCPAYGLSKRKLLYLSDLGTGNPHRDAGAYAVDLGDEGARLVYECDPDRISIEMLRSTKALIQGVEFVDDGERRGLRFDLRVETCFPHDSISIVMQKRFSGGRIEEHMAQWTPRLAGYVTFFDREAFSHASYEVFVPVAKKEEAFRLGVVVRADQAEERCVFKSTDSHQSRLAFGVPDAYWSIPDGIIRCCKNELSVRPSNWLKKIRQEVRYLRQLGKLGSEGKASQRLRMAYWATRPFFARKRVWAYYDKAYKAGDNAEYAFRYACKQKDGIEKVFYIYDDCDDSRRLAKEGYRVLVPETMIGSLYALNAEVIHMTHVPAYQKMGLKGKQLQYVKDLLDPAVIRLYHGFPITTSSSYTQIHSNAAGVVVGSHYEAQLYGAPENGFSPNQIIRSGMPRYDDLIDTGEKRILLAPSWRPSLPGKGLRGGEHQYNPSFKDSYYFKAYDAVLRDERLVETARRHGYKLTMFLHPTLSAQSVDFEATGIVESFSCTKDVDYVTIMRKSSLMVTDFSSVQYDFAYMRKPIVYFHDPALPYWRITNFDYENIGFGEICRTVDDLVETLCRYIENDCKQHDLYRERVESFFIHNDRCASQRVYESVRQISDKRKNTQDACVGAPTNV